MSNYKVTLDKQAPDMSQGIMVYLSAKQLKKLRAELGIVNSVSSRTALQTYLNQQL